MLRIVGYLGAYYKHNRNTEKHNRWIFWEIPGSILGNFLSIIDSGLAMLISLISPRKCFKLFCSIWWYAIGENYNSLSQPMNLSHSQVNNTSTAELIAGSLLITIHPCRAGLRGRQSRQPPRAPGFREPPNAKNRAPACSYQKIEIP